MDDHGGAHGISDVDSRSLTSPTFPPHLETRNETDIASGAVESCRPPILAPAATIHGTYGRETGKSTETRLA